MNTHTFKVKKDQHSAVSEEFSIQIPETLDMADWGHLVDGDEDAREARVIDLAVQSLTIKMQAAYRNSGTHPDDYRYGAKVARKAVEVDSSGEVEFTEEQLAYLKSKGARII